MTRKDYEKLAAVLRTGRAHLKDNPSEEGAAVLVVITNALCTTLSEDNPRFDHDRFVEAVWPRGEKTS